MKYGRIPGIEQPVGTIVLGAGSLSREDMERNCALLDAFTAAGGNCLDTARVYGTEPAVGRWLEERGNREKIVLVGKGAHPDDQGRRRVNPEAISEDISRSLEAMRTEYMDIYLLHRDDPDVPVGPIVECLNAEREEGRIRVFGGSNWTVERIQEANEYALAHELRPFVLSSPNLSLAVRNEQLRDGCIVLDDAAAAWHTETQFPLLPWSAQASGFFGGRYSPENRARPDMVRVYYNETNWERLRRARDLAERKGCTANNIALAYVLNQPYPVFAVIGAHNPEQLAGSLAAADIVLTPEELRWLRLETDRLDAA